MLKSIVRLNTVLIFAALILIFNGCGSPIDPSNKMLTTKVSPKSTDVMVTKVSQQMILWTIDDLVGGADTVLIGKVTKIFPAKKEELPTRTVIYTDVVIEPERYFYTDFESKNVCVRVEEGRVGNMVRMNDDEPSFTLGERCFVTLYRPPYERIPPNGFVDSEYYVVAGCLLGKYEVKGENLVGFDGRIEKISTIEQKVNSLRFKEK